MQDTATLEKCVTMIKVHILYMLKDKGDISFLDFYMLCKCVCIFFFFWGQFYGLFIYLFIFYVVYCYDIKFNVEAY